MDGMDRSDGNFLRHHYSDGDCHGRMADRSPSLERRGFLPIPTTPGDRLFIGILSSAYIFFAWIGLTHFALWILLIIVVCWIIIVMIWG